MRKNIDIEKLIVNSENYRFDPVDKPSETIVTALYGAPSLSDAINGSLPLIKSAEADFGK
jgi:hypothetical protein